MYDLIGDVHGCYDSLIALVKELGYDEHLLVHPEGRTLVFLGDIVDRGPASDKCLTLILSAFLGNRALLVQGNHDNKLFRWMKGNDVRVSDGLSTTIAQLEAMETPLWTVLGFSSMESLGAHLLDCVPYRLDLDNGLLTAVHAYPGDIDNKICLYGPTRGMGRIRKHWWFSYDQDPFVVFGHYWMNDPTPRLKWCCLDTSCCRGGRLAAMSYPEMTITQVEHKDGIHEEF